MFVDRIDGVDAKEVKRVFKELITAYMNPAYGSMSKRDFDRYIAFYEAARFKDYRERS